MMVIEVDDFDIIVGNTFLRMTGLKMTMILKTSSKNASLGSTRTT